MLKIVRKHIVDCMVSFVNEEPILNIKSKRKEVNNGSKTK